MPKFEVRVALCGHFEDVEIEADTPDEACWEALSQARAGDIIPCEPFEASCRDAFIDSVSDDEGNFDVPLHCMSRDDQEIYRLECSVKQLTAQIADLKAENESLQIRLREASP